MARKPFIAGNWKMNLTHLEGINLVQQTAYKLTDKDADDVTIAVIPSFTSIRSIQTLIEGDKLDFDLGAQDVAVQDSGAFTGAVSALQLKELNVDWVLAGHSERRSLFGDTDEIVNQKVLQILKHGMKVILCVGETLEEREAGKAAEVIERQVRAGYAGVSEAETAKVVVAYEPVWAIGTGKTATPEDADSGCKAVRDTVGALYNDEVAQATIVQYGGSVKPGNVKELMSQPNIDGALVGGACLTPDDFAALIRYNHM